MIKSNINNDNNKITFSEWEIPDKITDKINKDNTYSGKNGLEEIIQKEELFTNIEPK